MLLQMGKQEVLKGFGGEDIHFHHKPLPLAASKSFLRLPGFSKVFVGPEPECSNHSPTLYWHSFVTSVLPREFAS